MKLAELLNERKVIKEEIKNLKERLYLSARVQEGDTVPAEPPEELKSALINLFGKLKELIIKINETNLKTLTEEKNLMEWIAERDRCLSLSNMLHELAEKATPKPERFSRNEIRYVPTINIREIRMEADGYAQRAREADVIIQTANWNKEV